ncbi:MAG: glycosyltransferase [Thermoplasmata archaeon]|nr:glycosyltransferase [Thermoplasmata archaeon]
MAVFRRTEYYRDALRSIAAQDGPLPPVEVVVVRSPEVNIEVPAELAARGWSCTVVRSDAIGEGPFLADGLTALSSEFLLPLDDDDMWRSDRLGRVVNALRAHPAAGYYHNTQAYVDGQGRQLDTASALRRLRRFTGVPSRSLREVPAAQFRRRPSGLARWGAFFNNSSVAVRCAAMRECLPELRSTARLVDSFMFYAALSSGTSLLFDPTPSTNYRIHASNRSRGTKPPALAPPAELVSTRLGRLTSIAAMRTMVGRRGARWLDPWLDRDEAYIDLLESFREGEPDRVRTVVRAARLARRWEYVDPLMNAMLALTAGGLAVAPRVAQRAYSAEPKPVALASRRAPGP